MVDSANRSPRWIPDASGASGSRRDRSAGPTWHEARERPPQPGVVNDHLGQQLIESGGVPFRHRADRIERGQDE
jgi:hypothetical protein